MNTYAEFSFIQNPKYDPLFSKLFTFLYNNEYINIPANRGNYGTITEIKHFNTQTRNDMIECICKL